MKRSHLTALVAGATTLALAVSGCSGGGGATEAGGSVESLAVLDYYTSEPDIEKQLKDCGESIGVTIKHESVPGTSLIQTVLQQASSQTLPDVLMLDNPDIQQIAETGALAPLGDFGIDAEGFAEGPVAAATYEGELYGLQPGANTLAIFYRPDVLAEAGVEPPETWDELRTVAAKLTEGDRYGFAFNATADYEGAWQFLPAMWTNGGSETDLTSPEVAEALQLWKDLVDEGSASKSVVNWSQADVADQFVNGKAAMMLNGPWQIPTLEEAGVEFEVVPFPINEPGQTSVAPLGGEAWTVPMTGDQAKMAKAAELVKCMNSPEGQMRHAKEEGVVPTRLEVAEEFRTEVPEMAAWVDVVIGARARTAKLGPEWPEAAETIYTGMQLVLTGQAKPEEAMARAQG